MDVTDDTSGSLLLRIWLNISENDSDRGSALLAYFEIYCKAAWILNTGFKSTLALHPCNWIRLCRLIYGSFQADTSSGWPYLSLRIYVCPLISFGYPNLHTVSLFFFDSKAIGWTTPCMSLELIDQFYIILCIINDFVTTFLTGVYRWYRCVYPWVIRCHQWIDVLNGFLHQVFVFFHLIPVNDRCVSLFSYSVDMYAPTMLPLVTIPPIL